MASVRPQSTVRNPLIALAIGSVVCFAYGATRGFGYGLPPYSFIYTAAIGVVAGLVVYGLLAIKTRWRFRLAVAAIVVCALAFGTIAYAHRYPIPGFLAALQAPIAPARAAPPPLPRLPPLPRIPEAPGGARYHP